MLQGCKKEVCNEITYAKNDLPLIIKNNYKNNINNEDSVLSQLNRTLHRHTVFMINDLARLPSSNPLLQKKLQKLDCVFSEPLYLYLGMMPRRISYALQSDRLYNSILMKIQS